jgi:hypothetical protein
MCFSIIELIALILYETRKTLVSLRVYVKEPSSVVFSCIGLFKEESDRPRVYCRGDVPRALRARIALVVAGSAV